MKKQLSQETKTVHAARRALHEQRRLTWVPAMETRSPSGVKSEAAAKLAKAKVKHE